MALSRASETTMFGREWGRLSYLGKLLAGHQIPIVDIKHAAAIAVVLRGSRIERIDREQVGARAADREALVDCQMPVEIGCTDRQVDRPGHRKIDRLA